MQNASRKLILVTVRTFTTKTTTSCTFMNSRILVGALALEPSNNAHCCEKSNQYSTPKTFVLVNGKRRIRHCGTDGCGICNWRTRTFMRHSAFWHVAVGSIWMTFTMDPFADAGLAFGFHGRLHSFQRRIVLVEIHESTPSFFKHVPDPQRRLLIAYGTSSNHVMEPILARTYPCPSTHSTRPTLFPVIATAAAIERSKQCFSRIVLW